jgi:hypothetical protein
LSNSISNDTSQVTQPVLGWVIFLVGVLISSFFGGALKAFMSPTQLASWVEKELYKQDPKFTLSFDEIKFQLSDGAIPRFGFYTKGLSLSSKDPCTFRSKLYVEEVYFPLKIENLLKGKVSFSDIIANKVDLIYSDPICNSTLDNQEQLLNPEQIQNSQKDRYDIGLNNLREFADNRFLKDLINSRRWFNTLNFTEFNIYHTEKTNFKMVVNKFKLDVISVKENVSLQGEVTFDTEFLNLKKFKPLSFDILISNKELIFGSKGKFQEGSLEIHGELNFNSEDYFLEIKTSSFPIAEVLKSFEDPDSELSKMRTRFIWLDCIAKAQGKVSEITKLQINSDMCVVKSHTGQLKAKLIKIEPFSEKIVKQFEVNINKFSSSDLFQFFLVPVNNDLISNWGLLTGELKFDNKFHFQGKLNNLELVFKNDNQKRLQLINDIELNLFLDRNKFFGEIVNMKIQEGLFNGSISFNFKRLLMDGLILLKIKSLHFNRYVTQLLGELEHSPLEIYARLSLKEGKINEFQGIVGALKLEGHGIQIQKLKLDSKLSPGFWDFRARADKIKFLATSKFAQLTNKLFLVKDPNESLELDNIKGNFQYYNQEMSWSNIYAYYLPSNSVCSSEGKYSNNKVKGWVNVSNNYEKWNTWEIISQDDEVLFVPTFDLLKKIKPINSTVNIENIKTPEEKIKAFEKIRKDNKHERSEGIIDQTISIVKKFLSKVYSVKSDE